MTTIKHPGTLSPAAACVNGPLLVGEGLWPPCCVGGVVEGELVDDEDEDEEPTVGIIPASPPSLVVVGDVSWDVLGGMRSFEVVLPSVGLGPLPPAVRVVPPPGPVPVQVLPFLQQPVDMQ